jgi:hypothetical protein
LAAIYTVLTVLAALAALLLTALAGLLLLLARLLATTLLTAAALLTTLLAALLLLTRILVLILVSHTLPPEVRPPQWRERRHRREGCVEPQPHMGLSDATGAKYGSNFMR